METKSFTEKQLSSSKVKLFIAAAISFVTNFFVIVSLIVAGIDGIYFILPSLMAVLDLSFFVAAFFTNFRLKYGFAYGLFYTIANFAFMAGTVLILFLLTPGTIITITAIVLWGVCHAFSGIAIIFGALDGAKVGKALSIFALIILIVFAVFSAVYSVFVFSKGFLGQGFSGVRPIVYVYDADTDSYIADSVMEGRGDSIVIEQTFNGKKVSQINCEIFADVAFATVNTSDANYINRVAINDIRDGFTLVTLYDSVDALKKEFYDLAVNLNSEGYLNFANGIVPAVSEDENYLSFEYTLESAAEARGEYLPTIKAKQSGSYNLSELYTAGYMSHSDAGDTDDLVWCYENAEGKILSKSSLNAIEAATPENDCEVTIVFDEVYAVTIGEDNDSLYETDEDYKTTIYNARKYEYRFVTVYDCNELTNSLPARDGFDYSFEYAVNGQSKEILVDFEALLSRLNSGSEITLYPKWEMKKPTVNAIESDSQSYVYGDTLTLTGSALAAADNMDLTYEWSFDGSNVWSGGEYTKSNISPVTDSGIYTLKVTASSSQSSLTSYSMRTISITVNKRQLDLVWDIPDMEVYDSYEKQVSAVSDPVDIINGDSITLSLSVDSVINAGEYTSVASLTGECAKLYQISSSTLSRPFEILPAGAEVDWQNLSFVYDGTEKIPLASFSGVGSDGTVELSVEGMQKNAGEYIATAVSDNKNYLLSSLQTRFVILPKELTVSWDNLSMVYNGYAQLPKAILNGTVEKDNVAVSVSGGQKDVGTWQAAANITDSNYTLSQSTKTTSFEITKYEISVEWTGDEFIYNNSKQQPTAKINGLGVDGVITLTVSGGATDAGSHIAIASLSNNNYLLLNTEKEFEILPKSISVEWSKTSLTYSGIPQKPIAALKNVCNGDSVEVTVTGEQTFAGVGYEATASITDGNYVIEQNKTTVFNILPLSVTIQWDNLLFIYDKTAKTPTASFSGVGADGLITLSVSAGEVNVGNYIARASCSNSNYTLLNATAEYSITPKTVELVWSDTSVTYNGLSQKPSAEAGDGVVSGDTVNVTVSGAKTNAGTYTATAQIDNQNYAISDPTKVKEFTIEQYRINSLDWQNLTMTYNGLTQIPSVSFNGVGTDGKIILTATGGAKDVGNYVATALNTNSNYLITCSLSQSYDITSLAVDAVWENLTFVYDGQIHSPSAYINGAGEDGKIVLSVSGGKTDVGIYSATASGQGANYTLKNSSVQFEITQKEIFIVWEDKTSFTLGDDICYPVATADDGAAQSTLTYKITDADGYTVENITVAGEYKVTVSVGANYKISASSETEKTFTVNEVLEGEL